MWLAYEICMVGECQVPLQPLQNHLSGHLGGWAKLWSADETLNGPHQRKTSLSMPVMLLMASRRKDWKRISVKSSLMSTWRLYQSGNWTELDVYESLPSHPSTEEIFLSDTHWHQIIISSACTFIHSFCNNIVQPNVPYHSGRYLLSFI